MENLAEAQQDIEVDVAERVGQAEEEEYAEQQRMAKRQMMFNAFFNAMDFKKQQAGAGAMKKAGRFSAAVGFLKPNF